MEKMLGKKQFGELLNGLITKPSGKPVLTPSSDKRLPLGATSAADDFAN
jgi:hypothetical protein